MKVSIIQKYEEFVRKKKKKFKNFGNHDSFKITFDVRNITETLARIEQIWRAHFLHVQRTNKISVSPKPRSVFD